MNKNIINQIPKEELQELINNSTTIVEVLTKLKVDAYNGNHKILVKRINNESIDINNLVNNRKSHLSLKMFNSNFKVDNIEKDIFAIDSIVSKATIKKYILKNNLINYSCQKCKNTGEWLNSKLSLQLDHINGVNTDNRLENLRFLCPNCHSQTETFGSKNKKKTKKYCLDCSREIHKKSTRCNSCANKFSVFFRTGNKRFEASEEELVSLVKHYPMTKIGEMFGVSNNAIKKRCISLGIDYKALRKS